MTVFTGRNLILMRIRAATYTALTIGGTVGLALLLTGCMSAQEQQRANLNEDAGACADFGAYEGSRAYTQCMLDQQRRRDMEPLINAERARISAETARNNLEMVRRIRKDREQQ